MIAAALFSGAASPVRGTQPGSPRAEPALSSPPAMAPARAACRAPARSTVQKSGADCAADRPGRAPCTARVL